MKKKSIEYNLPETYTECMSTSCLGCYWYMTDRSQCEEFYRNKLRTYYSGD